jgi:hypothetical protein
VWRGRERASERWINLGLREEGGPGVAEGPSSLALPRRAFLTDISAACQHSALFISVSVSVSPLPLPRFLVFAAMAESSKRPQSAPSPDPGVSNAVHLLRKADKLTTLSFFNWWPDWQHATPLYEQAGSVTRALSRPNAWRSLVRPRWSASH